MAQSQQHSSAKPRSVAISVPGKVLIAGGYLVLDPSHSGLVLSTSSRFYAIVTTHSPYTNGSLLSPLPPLLSLKENQCRITFHSYQFIDPPRDYIFMKTPLELKIEAISSPPHPNKFIDTTVQLALTASANLAESSMFDSLFNQSQLHLILAADNDFYSQRDELQRRHLDPTFINLSSLPPFLKTNLALSKVKKTGLGSSATLVSSLTASIIYFFTHRLPMPIIHAVSQFAHGFAQGKIGSGFDIASALFGSQLYSRFSPDLVDAFFDLGSKTPWSYLHSFSNQLNATITPFLLPPFLELFLADISSGSHTPTLVSKVLSWKTQQPKEATTLWSHLHSLITSLTSLFHKLNSFDSLKFNNEVVKFPLPTSSPLNHDPKYQTLAELRFVFQEIRKAMREMGEASSTPIEPPEQSKLLDACFEIPGVIGGGVPGAGGHDAIYLIYFKPSSDQLLPQLESLFKEKFPYVTPMPSTVGVEGLIDESKLLDVKGSKLHNLLSAT